MKYLLLAIISTFIFTNCAEDFGTGPETIRDTVYVAPVNTFKASDVLNGKTTTWIEVEYELPQDTTWWTLCADSTMYAAWKKKVRTDTYIIPTWRPWVECRTVKSVYICDTMKNSYGVPVNTAGRTYSAHMAYYSPIKAYYDTAFMPIEYYKGSWGVNSKNLLCITPRRVRPGVAQGLIDQPYECDLVRCTWVETQISFCYIHWHSGSDSTLVGHQAYSDGSVQNVRDGNPDVLFKRWSGLHLYDIANPIFLQ